MRYYLSPWVGDGTPMTNPFRVRGMDQPGCRVIDLRPDASVASGRALCVAQTLPTGANVFDLGPDLDTPSPAIKAGLQTRLGVTLDFDNLRDIIMDLLILHAGGARWRPLKALRRGGFEIFLGEQIYRQRPIGGGASFTEDWNCADSAALTCDLTWDEYSGGSLTLTTNRCRISGNVSLNYARAQHDTDTDDQRVQATIPTLTLSTFTIVMQIIARKDSTATQSFYGWGPAKDSTPTDLHSLIKYVSGAETLFGTSADDYAVDEVIKLEVDGSSIKGFINGVEKIAVTDTSVVGNTRGGIRAYSDSAGNSATLDNWSIADIAAGRTTKNTRSHPLGVSVGHPQRLVA